MTTTDYRVDAQHIFAIAQSHYTAGNTFTAIDYIEHAFGVERYLARGILERNVNAWVENNQLKVDAVVATGI